ncbi:hypothetical protein ACIXUO_04650 [Bacteroides fragilis]
MEAGDYLLVVVLIVLVVVGLIINPAIGLTFIFFLFIHGKVKSQKAEQAKNAELYKWRQEKRIDVNLDAMNKRITKKEETKKNRL